MNTPHYEQAAAQDRRKWNAQNTVIKVNNNITGDILRHQKRLRSCIYCLISRCWLLRQACVLFADFSEFIFKSFFVYKVIDIEVPSFDVPSCLEVTFIFLGLHISDISRYFYTGLVLIQQITCRSNFVMNDNLQKLFLKRCYLQTYADF